MKIENTIKELLIIIYKFFVYSINYFIFAIGFSFVNPTLLKLGRQSVLSLFIYCLTLVLLLPVFRNFDIGYRKSKPVIFSTAVVYLIALFIMYTTQIILNIRLSSFDYIFNYGLIILIPIIIIQLFVLYVLTHLGNNIYFKLFDKSNTLILFNNITHLKTIETYVNSHDKQYRLRGVIELENTTVIPEDIDTIFLVGVKNEFKDYIHSYAYINTINILYTASINDVLSGKQNSTVIDDILLIESKSLNLTLSQLFIKRTIDLILSIIFLIFASPIFVIVAIAIKLDDNGPIFYKQERLTINSKKFNIIKFRSMKEDAGFSPATANDSRITKVGNILRKLRIDELPQFINILKGDMSIVGPRPESTPIMRIIEKDLPEFSYRLKVKAGLTGYAQIFGKYNTNPEQKLILDLKYIMNFSIANDLKLILQTTNIFFDSSDSTTGYDVTDERVT